MEIDSTFCTIAMWNCPSILDNFILPTLFLNGPLTFQKQLDFENGDWNLAWEHSNWNWLKKYLKKKLFCWKWNCLKNKIVCTDAIEVGRALFNDNLQNVIALDGRVVVVASDVLHFGNNVAFFGQYECIDYVNSVTCHPVQISHQNRTGQ